MDTIKGLAIAVAATGVAYLMYKNRDVLFKQRKLSYDSRNKKNKNSTTDAMAVVCDAFLTYADNFQGLFEPIYQASVNTISYERKKNVLVEWNIRMGGIGAAPVCLIRWWETIVKDLESLPDMELKKRAQNVVQMIGSCGIIRDNRLELTASERTPIYYQQVEGFSWEIGQQLRVESPCWYVPSSPVRIIEKGYIEII